MADIFFSLNEPRQGRTFPLLPGLKRLNRTQFSFEQQLAAAESNEVRLLVSGQVRSKRDSEGKAAFSGVEWVVPGGGQTLIIVGYLLKNQRFPRHTEDLSGTIREAGNLMYVHSIQTLPVSISMAKTLRKGWELDTPGTNGSVLL